MEVKVWNVKERVVWFWFPTLDAGDRVPRTALDAVPRVPRTASNAVPRVPRTASNAVSRVPRTASRDEAQDWSQISLKDSQNSQNLIKSPKVNMSKFGDVSFDFGFEW